MAEDNIVVKVLTDQIGKIDAGLDRNRIVDIMARLIFCERANEHKKSVVKETNEIVIEELRNILNPVRDGDGLLSKLLYKIDMTKPENISGFIRGQIEGNILGIYLKNKEIESLVEQIREIFFRIVMSSDTIDNSINNCLKFLPSDLLHEKSISWIDGITIDIEEYKAEKYTVESEINVYLFAAVI
jgi:hypothetical protein